MSELRKTDADRIARVTKDAQTLALMRNVGDALTPSTEAGVRPTVAEVLGQTVTRSMVDSAIESRKGFMGAYLDPVSSRPFRFTDADQKSEMVGRLLARENAHDVLANGLGVAETKDDIAIWHQLMAHPDFLSFGKRPVADEKPLLLPVPQSSQVIEAIGRVGGDSKLYLGSMAAKWWTIYRKRDTDVHPVELDDLATHIVQRAQYQLEGPSTEFRLRDLAGEFKFSVASPEKFFAAELHRRTNEAHPLPQTPNAVLSAVKSRVVNSKKGWYYKGLAEHAEAMLLRDDLLDVNSRDPDFYRDAGFTLLWKTLEFVGKEDPDVKMIAQNIAPARARERAKRVEDQTAKVISLANNFLVREYIGECSSEERGRLATVPGVRVKNGYDAADRLLIALEGRVKSNGVNKETEQTVVDIAQCVRTILQFGDRRAAVAYPKH